MHATNVLLKNLFRHTYKLTGIFWMAGISSLAQAAIPVIFDSDIGSDMDDTIALSLILKSPEFDLKLLVTATEDTEYRAKVAAKFLQLAQRSDVPVGMGRSGKVTAEFQKPWVVDYQLSDYPGEIVRDGVARMIQLIRQSPEPVTLIVAGPMHNIQEALKRAPDIAAKVNLVGMHGSIDKGYDDKPSAEYNVANNVPAFQSVLAAPWRSFSIAPLDTCGDMILDGEQYQALRASQDPQLRAIFENYAIWAKLVTWDKVDYLASRSSILYDTVAIYLALEDHPYVSVTQLQLRVTKDGFLIRADSGRKANVALQWNNKPAFKDWLTQRLLSSTNHSITN